MGARRMHGGGGVPSRLSPTFQKQAQRLADLHEDLDLKRYPARVRMRQTVDEAATRAESMARLDHALQLLR